MARPVATMPVMDAWPAWRRRLWGHLTSGYAGLRRVWQRATHAAAIDRTATTADRPCLVLAPHADDETLRCGALIARKRASGTPVWVVVATDGRLAIESVRAATAWHGRAHRHTTRWRRLPHIRPAMPAAMASQRRRRRADNSR